MVINEKPVVAPGRPDVPIWIDWPVRAVAIVVVVPVRLLWELVAVAARLVDRWLLRPIGRLLYLLIWRPLRWLVTYLLVVPLTFLFRYLLVVPLTFLFRYLVVVPLTFLFRYLLVVPLSWLWCLGQLVGRFLLRHVLAPLGRLLHLLIWRPLRWLVTYLLVVPIGWLVGVLAPVGRLLGRAVVGAWHTACWLLRAAGRRLAALARFTYRYLLRPIGLATAWVWRHTVGLLWRGLVVLCRATVVPAARWTYHGLLAPTGRWLRDAVFRPAGAVVRTVLTALAFQRRA